MISEKELEARIPSSENQDTSDNTEKVDITYETARNSLLPLKHNMDMLVQEGIIDEYSLVLTGSSAYEFREPTDIDVFLIYHKATKTDTLTKETEPQDTDFTYGDIEIGPRDAVKKIENVGHGIAGTDYSPVNEMIRDDISGHRRLMIEGIEVDVQVNSREQFMRILNESEAHARFRLLGKKGFLYMASERDDVNNEYRKAVWFLSPLLAAADKKVNPKLQGSIESAYQQIDNLLKGKQREEVADEPLTLPQLLNDNFVEYLSGLNWLTRHEVEFAVSEVRKAFTMDGFVPRAELKQIFNKLIKGMTSVQDMEYSYRKSLITKVSNYWHGQNFVSNGLDLGAQLIAGSDIEADSKSIFKHDGRDFLSE